MKALAVFFAMTLTGVAANAFVPVPGSFVASQCGESAAQREFGLGTTNIGEVCVGQVTSVDGKPAAPAVEFRFTDGTAKLFHIARVDNLMVALLSGKTKSVVFLVSSDGQQAAMKVINSKEGGIESAQGMLSGQPFFVQGFESVFHTF